MELLVVATVVCLVVCLVVCIWLLDPVGRSVELMVVDSRPPELVVVDICADPSKSLVDVVAEGVVVVVVVDVDVVVL